MAITEAARHRLYLSLEKALGSEEAATFMEHMPPVGWADVATKRDLEQSGALSAATLRSEMAMFAATLRSEMADLRADVRSEMADLRGDLRLEMADLRADVRSEMAGLRGDLRSEMADLRGSLRVDLADGLRLQTYAILGGGSVLVGVGSVLSRLL